MKLEVKDLEKDVSKYGKWLVGTWCICLPGESKFLCYIADGCCRCGVEKHHTHCKMCGGVLQVG